MPKDTKNEQKHWKHMLNCLGAYRLLKHFQGDWKAAEAHAVKETQGEWPIRGKPAWDAAVKLLENAVNTVKVSKTHLQLTEFLKSPEGQRLFPGVESTDQLPPWVQLTSEQKAFAIKIAPKNIRQEWLDQALQEAQARS